MPRFGHRLMTEQSGIALVQVGGDSCDAFLDQAAEPLLEKLRAAAG